MYERLENKRALITGASSGIGESFAKELHRRGAGVILVARRKEKLEALQNAFNHVRPGSCEVLVLDLSQMDAIDEVEKLCHAHPFEILVNNVGRGSFGYFDELNINDEVEMVTLNVIAPLKILRAVSEVMKQKRTGIIFSVSSIAAFQPLPFMATYSATKSFNFNHSLAVGSELAEFGIKSITICPGPTATEFGAAANVPDGMKHLGNDTSELVVTQTFAALEKNRAYVVTGMKSKVMTLFSNITPVRFSMWLVKRALR